MNFYLISLNLIIFNLLISFLSMNNWISMWFISEILLFIISILLLKKNFSNPILTFKMFLINSFLSIILILIILNLNINIMFNIYKFMIFMILWMKNNLFPFNLWFMFICKINNWLMFFMISILMKFPFMIFLYLIINNMFYNLLIFMIIIPMIIFNFINIKKILFILSINNIMWFILIMYVNNLMWLIIYISYMFLNLILFKIFNKFNFFFINQINLMNLNYKILIIFITFNLMNFPPLMMFMFKWILIKIIFLNKIILLIFMINNLILYIFYIKLILIILNLFFYQMKWIKMFNMKLMMNNFNFIFLFFFLML